jgi:anti-sigma factor RsiW
MSDQWMDRLSEYLDGELDDGERVALEAHLQTCADCAAVVADLRRVVYRARTLEAEAPHRDLWPAIAARIGASPSGSTQTVDPAARRPGRRWSFSLPQLAAAGIALMALSGGTVWLVRGPAARPTAAIVASPPGTTPVINAVAKPTATQSYAAAVADLEQVLAHGRGQLDTSTVRVIEQNLAAIDRAIAQAQRAIDGEGAFRYLNSHRAETVPRKLDLLRQAAALVPVS